RVYRNGAVVATTADDGAHSDRIGRNVSGSFTYRVCETDSGDCSDDATVTFLTGPTASATAGEAFETALLGAHPNPFNPATTTRFSLAERADVELAVYNSIGQRVAVLASGTLEAGRLRRLGAAERGVP